MNAAPLAAFYALTGAPDDSRVLVERLDVLDWGQTLVFAGRVGERGFELRYADCRDLRWRVYVADPAPLTPLVGFSPGRDQQRSPAQFLTAHFGLTLYFGSVSLVIA
jgi:hypothetical protein